MMGPNDVVRLRNAGTDPFNGKYSNQPYRIMPGGEAIAPFIAVCLWFGHPDAIDEGPRDRHRFNERERLRIKYGVYDDDTKWEPNTPKVEVYTLEGDRILTVLDDPEGVHLSPATTTMAEQSVMEDQLQQLQRQVHAMQAALEIKARETQAEASGDIITDDAAPGSLTQDFIPAVPLPDSSPTPAVTTPTSRTSSDPADSDAVTEDTPTRVRVGSPVT